MRNVFLYYNPHAGNKVIATKLDYIINEFRKANQLCTVYRAKRNQNPLDIFTNELLKNFSKIIVSGGDGTIHQVVSALIKNKLNLPIAIIPAGTSNDYAYTLDIPSKLEDAVKIAVKNKYKEVDIVSVNDRIFINVFAVGNIVTVSQSTDDALKKTFGPLAYYLNGISKLSTVKPFDAEIKSAEKKFSGKIIFALFLNGKSAGGFNKIAPLANIEDGLIDVVVFKEMPFYAFPNTFMQVLTGKIHRNRNVLIWQTKEVEIKSKVKILTDIDGERGNPLPAKLSVLPDRLKIITNG